MMFALSTNSAGALHVAGASWLVVAAAAATRPNPLRAALACVGRVAELRAGVRACAIAVAITVQMYRGKVSRSRDEAVGGKGKAYPPPLPGNLRRRYALRTPKSNRGQGGPPEISFSQGNSL